jgi:hypothetical protein
MKLENRMKEVRNKFKKSGMELKLWCLEEEKWGIDCQNTF